jgi:3-hydroxyisobutyrate dehydrogenase-like beta-hydroxyacid dehydrogenase
MEVGFIGLGRMGTAMARNLAKAGHRVRAWNRSPVAGGPLPGGMELVGAPAEAFLADAVFTMLSDDAAIRDVLLSSGVLPAARPGLVHVVASTISVGFADELSALHAQAGIGYVAAPVFGRPEAAETAQLEVLAAGAMGAVGKVRPLLDAIGKRTWVVGEDPKQANAVKIAGNAMIASAIETLAETAVLARGNGVAPQAFFDLMLGTLFDCPVYQSYAARIVNGEFEPGFAMSLGLKDLRLAAAASRQSLPVLDAVRGRITEAVEAGMGGKDWSGIADYVLTGTGET